MSRPALILRWCLPLSLFVLAVLCLNSAFANAWLSGGPPTKIPEHYGHTAFSHFWYGIALLLCAVASFLIWTSRKRGLSLFGIAMLAALIPWGWRFFLLDSCLDNRGQWNYEFSRCQFEGQRENNKNKMDQTANLSEAVIP